MLKRYDIHQISRPFIGGGLTVYLVSAAGESLILENRSQALLERIMGKDFRMGTPGYPYPLSHKELEELSNDK